MNEVPDKAGWYWFRKYPSQPWRVEYVSDTESPAGLMMKGWRVQLWSHETAGRCQWVGPIPEPPEEPMSEIDDDSEHAPVSMRRMGDVMMDGNEATPQEVESMCVELRQHRRIRPAVRWFAEQMENRLQANDHKRDLDRPTYEECIAALNKHVAKLADSFRFDDENDPLQSAIHAANAANWMLLAIGKDINDRNAELTQFPGTT